MFFASVDCSTKFLTLTDGGDKSLDKDEINLGEKFFNIDVMQISLQMNVLTD